MDEQHCLALAAGNADVSLTGLAGAVDDTAHDSHLDGLFAALKPTLHLICDFGAGVLGAAAGRAGDDLRAGHREADSAQDIVACFHFLLRVSCQRDTDGVADPLQQHPADAHAALEQAHLVSAGLRDAHMERVVGHSAELAVCLHHAGDVGVLDGDDDVLEVELFQQTDMVQSALHHRFRHRCAVLGEDVLFQTAAVDADADGDIFLLAGIHDRLHAVIVADVARVDADLIHAHVGAGDGSLVVEVDVRHDGDIHGVLDSLDALGVCRAGTGHAQDLTACRFAALCLRHIALDVLHRDVQHGLHGNGILAADGHIADLHFTFQLPHGFTSFKLLRSRAGRCHCTLQRASGRTAAQRLRRSGCPGSFPALHGR